MQGSTSTVSMNRAPVDMNGDEVDAFGPGRKHLACLVNHPGGARKTRVRYTRRARHAANQALRTGQFDRT